MSPAAVRRRSLLLLAAGMLSGCGPSGGTIGGTVTVDGQPLPHGMLMVHDEAGGVLSTPITAGDYQLPEVPVGPARLAVRSLPPPPMMAPPPTTGPREQAASDRAGFVRLADAYADPASSGLGMEVAAGWQQHDLSLSSRGPGAAPAGE